MYLGYDPDDEDEFDYFDDWWGFEQEDDTCAHCGGSGLSWDGIDACPYCDGEGYYWWL